MLLSSIHRYTLNFFISSIISSLTSLSTCDNLVSSRYCAIVHYFLLIIFFQTSIIWVYLEFILTEVFESSLYNCKSYYVNPHISHNTCMYKPFLHCKKLHYCCALDSHSKWYPQITPKNSTIMSFFWDFIL